MARTKHTVRFAKSGQSPSMSGSTRRNRTTDKGTKIAQETADADVDFAEAAQAGKKARERNSEASASQSHHQEEQLADKAVSKEKKRKRRSHDERREEKRRRRDHKSDEAVDGSAKVVATFISDGDSCDRSLPEHYSDTAWIHDERSAVHASIVMVAKWIRMLLVMIRGNRLRNLKPDVFVGVGRFLVQEERMKFPDFTRRAFLEIFHWEDSRVNASTTKLVDLVFGSNCQVKISQHLEKLYVMFKDYMMSACLNEEKCRVFGVLPEDVFVPCPKGSTELGLPSMRKELPSFEEGRSWAHYSFISKGFYKVSAFYSVVSVWVCMYGRES